MLLIFFSVGESGNGGEYWGFNGRESAREAAERRFELSDTRLLKVDLQSALDERIEETPTGLVCDDEEGPSDLQVRKSAPTLLHGIDSPRIASAFAFDYNSMMGWLLATSRGSDCGMAWRPSHAVRMPDSIDVVTPLAIGSVVIFFSLIVAITADLRAPDRRLVRVQRKLAKRSEVDRQVNQRREDLEAERRLGRTYGRGRRPRGQGR